MSWQQSECRQALKRENDERKFLVTGSFTRSNACGQLIARRVTWESTIDAWQDGKAAKKALIAVAHSILVIIPHILQEGRLIMFRKRGRATEFCDLQGPLSAFITFGVEYTESGEEKIVGKNGHSLSGVNLDVKLLIFGHYSVDERCSPLAVSQELA